MNKQEVADWYMETFADKTLSFGCLIHSDWLFWKDRATHKIMDDRYIKVDVDSSMKYEWPARCISFEEAYCAWFQFYIGWETEIIWHPLTRWYFYQELYNSVKERLIKWEKVFNLVNQLRRILFGKNLLGKTIYERVEDEKVLKILVSIKELYEKKGSNREDKSTMT